MTSDAPRGGIAISLLIAALSALALGAGCPKDVARSPLEQTRAFYGSRPLEERPKGDWQTIPTGLPDLRAQSCGACHREIYDEWKDSTHALAWVDRQFQGEIKKSENRWLCANCHTPLLNQMERWAVALEGDDVEKPRYVENPAYDSAFRDEGITCAACHVRDGAIEGPTGIATPAHATRKAERFLDETICVDCHQAVREYPGKTFTCVFNTGVEWKQGPYDDEGRVCQSCHMPEVTRAQALGAEPRPGRRHGWPGSGIYKEKGRGPPLDWLPPGIDVRADVEGALLKLTLENKNAGHMLPTGDPERFITVDVRFMAADDVALGSENIRIGQTWEWWPAPKKLGDNRLGPREARVVDVAVPAGAVRYEVVVTSHRISDEAHAYHHLGDYPKDRETQRLSGAL